MPRQTPEDIVTSFRETFPGQVQDVTIERFTHGLRKREIAHCWMTVPPRLLHQVAAHLFTFDEAPHFAVASGYDAGDDVVLLYHFSLFHGTPGCEVSLNVRVSLPKTDLCIETLTDLFPGALLSEQEKQEMLGITVVGIPADVRAFIADDFPKGVYPWRKDSTGPKALVRNLHERKP